MEWIRRAAAVEVCDERPNILGEFPLDGFIADAKRYPTSGNSPKLNSRVFQSKADRAVFATVSLTTDCPPSLINAGLINKDFYGHCSVKAEILKVGAT